MGDPFKMHHTLTKVQFSVIYAFWRELYSMANNAFIFSPGEVPRRTSVAHKHHLTLKAFRKKCNTNTHFLIYSLSSLRPRKLLFDSQCGICFLQLKIKSQSPILSKFILVSDASLPLLGALSLLSHVHANSLGTGACV